MKAVSTNKAPAAIGPYSQAQIVGNLVYTSGQIPIIPEPDRSPSSPRPALWLRGWRPRPTRSSKTWASC